MPFTKSFANKQQLVTVTQQKNSPKQVVKGFKGFSKRSEMPELWMYLLGEVVGESFLGQRHESKVVASFLSVCCFKMSPSSSGPRHACCHLGEDKVCQWRGNSLNLWGGSLLPPAWFFSFKTVPWSFSNNQWTCMFWYSRCDLYLDLFSLSFELLLLFAIVDEFSLCRRR